MFGRAALLKLTETNSSLIITYTSNISISWSYILHIKRRSIKVDVTLKNLNSFHIGAKPSRSQWNMTFRCSSAKIWCFLFLTSSLGRKEYRLFNLRILLVSRSFSLLQMKYRSTEVQKSQDNFEDSRAGLVSQLDPRLWLVVFHKKDCLCCKTWILVEKILLKSIKFTLIQFFWAEGKLKFKIKPEFNFFQGRVRVNLNSAGGGVFQLASHFTPRVWLN